MRRPAPFRLHSFAPLLCLLLAGLLIGCVGKGKYDEAIDAMANLQAEHDALGAESDRLRTELRNARTLQAQTEGEMDARQTRIDRLQALLQETGEERERLMARLEELSAIESEERERNRIYREFIERFQAQIDAGQLNVSISRGRLVIELPQDILFGSGSASLAEDGQATLREVATVLAEFDDRIFQIEGHTDNVPIATRAFPSNWELSTARALAVVRLMTEAGVHPSNISAAGFSEYQPRASNEEAEGRRLNRRIEIVMLPNLDVFSDSPVASGS